MNSMPGELLLSTSATSIGSAAAADATAIAPATARVASRAWPTVLAENRKSPLELLAMTGLHLVYRLAPGCRCLPIYSLPMSRICDGHHKISLFHRPERTGVGRRPATPMKATSARPVRGICGGKGPKRLGTCRILRETGESTGH